MWWTVGFIFLVIILGAKLGSDNVSTSVARDSYEKKKTKKDEFFDKYCASATMENDLRKLIAAGDPEIIEIKKEITNMIGAYPTYIMLFSGALAKKGKIPSKARWWYSTNHIPEKNDCPLVEPFIDKPVFDESVVRVDGDKSVAWLNFLKWYDNELRNNGMKYPLLCIPRSENPDSVANGYYFMEKAIPIWEYEYGERSTEGYRETHKEYIMDSLAVFWRVSVLPMTVVGGRRDGWIVNSQKTIID